MTIPDTETAKAQKLEPCHHMETLVSALSDDTLKGPARWYTKFHILTCPKCNAALQGLRAMRSDLATISLTEVERPAAALSNERHAQIGQALDEVDRRRD